MKLEICRDNKEVSILVIDETKNTTVARMQLNPDRAIECGNTLVFLGKFIKNNWVERVK